MVTTISNFSGDITKQYALGEIDTRFPYITEVVPADDSTAFTAGQVLIYDIANNEYVLGSGGDAITNVVVAIEDKSETAERVNVLICGLVCVQTTTVLVEHDYCKIAADGKIAKWENGVDDLNICAPIIYKKIASKINQGFGVKPDNATATGDGSRVLIWLNSQLGRPINPASA